MTARTKKLIFAIAPTSRGFGFVMFSGKRCSDHRVTVLA